MTNQEIRMKTYVIYDRKTGEILQTHVRTDDRGGPQDIVSMARREADRQSIDVLPVDQIVPGAGYKVDVKTKKLVAVEPNKVKGASAAFVQPVGGDPRVARKVFFDVRAKKME
jgi:hypothetical protein